MRSHNVPSAAIIDSDQIVTATLGIRDKVAIEKNEGDPGFVETIGDGPVDSVLPRSQFQRSKKDPGDFSRNELTAGLGSLLFNVGRVSQGASPQENVLATVLCLGHPAANGFKNFRAAELRDQQPERIAVCASVRAHVAAGAGTSLDKAN